MNADGSGQHRLTDNRAEDVCPCISPDGSRVAFCSNRDGNYELYVINVDGTGLERLTETPTNERHPSWTPDSKRIVYADMPSHSGGGDIWIIGADGADPRPLTQGRHCQLPSVTYDGEFIVYSDQASGSFDVHIMKIDGTDSKLLAGTGDQELYARPSPDRQTIVFVKMASMSSPRNMYFMDIDGGNVRPLTQGSSTSEDPFWSPGGSRIVFQSDRTGNYEIYIMNADGTGVTNLTRHGGPDFWPSWAVRGR
jgi:TolB protein